MALRNGFISIELDALCCGSFHDHLPLQDGTTSAASSSATPKSTKLPPQYNSEKKT